MNLITVSRAAHWYDMDGNPCHTVLSANGERRPTDLRDAKKLKLLPSVTTWLKVLSADGLNAWQRTQDILAALTLPKKEGETDQEFAKRIQEDSEAYMYKKAEWGTRVHAVVEQICKDGTFQMLFGEPELNQVGAAFDTWYKENVAKVLGSEIRLVNAKLGYAGTCDLIYENKQGQVVIADIKTSDLKGKDTFAPYSKWGYQLAAYRMAYGRRVDALKTIVLPSDDYNRVFVYDWSQSKKWDNLDAMVELLIKAWRIEKDYPWQNT